MTELSYFQNSTFVGDASEAPYTAKKFHSILNALYNSNYGITAGASVAFVGGQTVLVSPSESFIHGVYCGGSENVVLENNTSTYSRIDVVGLRIDWINQTVTPMAIRGTGSAYPEVPTLQQEEGVIWEFPMAYCYINPAFAGFGNALIYEVVRSYNRNYRTKTYNNVMHNSEFIGRAGTGADGLSPAMWESTGSPSIITATYYPGVSPRKQTNLNVTLDSTSTLSTVKHLYNGNILSNLQLALLVTHGSLDISIDGGVSTEKTIYPTKDPLLIYINEVVASNLQLHFSTTEDYTRFYLFNVQIGDGTVLPNDEIILFGYPLNVLSSSLRSPATYSVGSAAYGPRVQQVLFNLDYSGATSAATATAYASLKPNYAQYTATDCDALRIETGNLPNNTVREAEGWCNNSCQLEVGSIAATVEVNAVGIVT